MAVHRAAAAPRLNPRPGIRPSGPWLIPTAITVFVLGVAAYASRDGRVALLIVAADGCICCLAAYIVVWRLMPRYYEFLTDAAPAEIAALRAGGAHPMEAKKRLAGTIVTEYHGAEAADDAREYFESKFQRREFPQDAPVFRVAKPWTR